MTERDQPAPASLLDAPQGVSLRIREISGGENAHRRLLALGFHPGDVVVLESQGILNGPLLLRNARTGAQVAIGRGIDQKILVEPCETAS